MISSIQVFLQRIKLHGLLSLAQTFIVLLFFQFVGVSSNCFAQTHPFVGRVPEEILSGFTLAEGPETSINFTVPKMSRVTLTIYDILGRSIRTLVSETKAAGSYNVTWNGKNDQGQQLASGLYFYNLQAGEFSATKKMMLHK